MDIFFSRNVYVFGYVVAGFACVTSAFTFFPIISPASADGIEKINASTFLSIYACMYVQYIVCLCSKFLVFVTYVFIR